jgi:hypothetical protein
MGCVNLTKNFYTPEDPTGTIFGGVSISAFITPQPPRRRKKNMGCDNLTKISKHLKIRQEPSSEGLVFLLLLLPNPLRGARNIWGATT